jgi:hypothetical protein
VTRRRRLVCGGLTLAVLMTPPTAAGDSPGPPGIAPALQPRFSLRVGDTVNASPGTFGGGAATSYDYQWRRCDPSGASCAGIDGAGGNAPAIPSYTTVAADLGATIGLSVAARNGDGSSAPAFAAVTTAIGPTSTLPVVDDPALAGAWYATLVAHLDLPAGTWNVSFDYGPTASYGTTIAVKGSPVAGGASYSARSTVHLLPSSSYHFRAVAFDGTTTYTGDDVELTTLAPNARTDCTDGIQSGAGGFSYSLCGAIDLDQVRLGQLPNDGLMYCAPTATMDLLAYLAASNPGLAPGVADWTAPANFDVMSQQLAALGSLMHTDPIGGTGGHGLELGFAKWLSQSGYDGDYVVSHVNASTPPGVDIAGMEAAAATGAFVIPMLGFYDSAGTRVGGHVTFMAGISGPADASTAILTLSDPYTPAIDDDVQYPYSADQIQIAEEPMPPSLPQRELPTPLDYSYPGTLTVFDNYSVVSPRWYAAAGGGKLVVAAAARRAGHAPARQTFRMPAAVTSVALPPGGTHVDFLTGGAGSLAGRLIEVDRTSGRRLVLATGLHDPRDLVVAGRRALRYVLSRRGVTAFTPRGRRVAHAAIARAAQAAMAWDYGRERLVVASSHTHRLSFFDPMLRRHRQRAVPSAALAGRGRLEVAVASDGAVLLHRSGATAVRAIPLRPGPAVVRRLRGATAPAGMTSDDMGRILVVDRGGTVAFAGDGTRRTDALPAGLPTGTKLAVLNSHDPYPSGAPGPALDTPPDVRTRLAGDGLFRVAKP